MASFVLPPDPEPEAAIEMCAGGGMRKGSVRDGAAEEVGGAMTSCTGGGGGGAL